MNIRKVWRWLFPDVSQVVPGSLWLAKRPFYVDHLSSHDLYWVREVCSSGTLFIDLVHHTGDRPTRPDTPLLMNSTTAWRSHLPRSHRLVTPEEARALGFLLPPVDGRHR